MSSKTIKVMIVEDSPVVQELLRHMISEDPRLEVAAVVDNAEEALRKLNQVQPDVISLDIRLPGMNGLDATLQIMSSRPTPIVVVSASVEKEDLNITMNALRAGALAVVEKPVGVGDDDYQTMARQLCDQLAGMSQVKVVRQTVRRNLDFGSKTKSAPEAAFTTPGVMAPSAPPKVLGIVASTGGPNAISQVLCGLGGAFPLPILAVQHITDGFTEGFVNWLNDVTPFKVVIAKNGETPVPGKVYLPPEDRHLEIREGLLKISAGGMVDAHRPSGTTLFSSMARDQGAKALGVLLTGMGTDGAAGLLEIKKAGGHTIAESESTAVIYGMPAEAEALSAVRETLPLEAIAPGVMNAVSAKRK